MLNANPVAPAPAHLPRFVLLFDGSCAVCDSTVQWLTDRDPEARLAYAPLSGPTAAAVRARHPEWPENLDSLVLVEQTAGGERIHWYSTAMLRSVGQLDGFVPTLARLALWFPRPLRDVFYRAFARIRYRVFGRLESCRIPTPDLQARFLD